jgi:hypothetical protein
LALLKSTAIVGFITPSSDRLNWVTMSTSAIAIVVTMRQMAIRSLVIVYIVVRTVIFVIPRILQRRHNIVPLHDWLCIGI